MARHTMTLKIEGLGLSRHAARPGALDGENITNREPRPRPHGLYGPEPRTRDPLRAGVCVRP